jgi:hypothetical protein
MISLALLITAICLEPISAAASPPAELFSPLISSKVLAIAKAEPSPAQYPQYTDTSAGIWKFFIPDTWTSGFFPATMYAMD